MEGGEDDEFGDLPMSKETAAACCCVDGSAAAATAIFDTAAFTPLVASRKSRSRSRNGRWCLQMFQQLLKIFRSAVVVVVIIVGRWWRSDSGVVVLLPVIAIVVFRIIAIRGIRIAAPVVIARLTIRRLRPPLPLQQQQLLLFFATNSQRILPPPPLPSSHHHGIIFVTATVRVHGNILLVHSSSATTATLPRR